MKSTPLTRFTDMDEYKDEEIQAKDNYFSTKSSFRIANGSQNNNSSSLAPLETDNEQGCCSSFVHFVRHDHEYSLYCLSTTNPARRLCRFIVDSKYPFSAIF